VNNNDKKCESKMMLLDQVVGIKREEEIHRSQLCLWWLKPQIVTLLAVTPRAVAVWKATKIADQRHSMTELMANRGNISSTVPRKTPKNNMQLSTVHNTVVIGTGRLEEVAILIFQTASTRIRILRFVRRAKITSRAITKPFRGITILKEDEGERA